MELLLLPDREDARLTHASAGLLNKRIGFSGGLQWLRSAVCCCHDILRPHHERQAMKVHFDKQSDAIYFRLDDSKIVESEENEARDHP